jgi:acyl dehydratase
MQFEELNVGRVIEAGPRAVTEQEIIDFARRYDPQYFHIDPARAAMSRWGGLIASGWMTDGIDCAQRFPVRRLARPRKIGMAPSGATGR